MELVNQTHAIVDLIPVTRTEDGEPTLDLEVTVVFKATYELLPSGALVPSARRLPILAEPLETPFGVLGGDRFVRKAGVDFCVLGTVRLPAPAREHTVTARLGAFSSSLSVFGDRRWKRSGRALALGAPDGFTEMPLSYARAFGGAARSEDLGVPHQDNPAGRGFYLEEDEAEDNLAPNVLDAGAAPIAAWTDRPAVAGWAPYPFFWALRGATALELDVEKRRVVRMAPSIHNHAHPALVLERVLPGEPVRIEGLAARPVAFDVPAERWGVRASIGSTTAEAYADIDGVYVWVDAAKVVVTQRAHFESTFRRGEARKIVTSLVGPS